MQIIDESFERRKSCTQLRITKFCTARAKIMDWLNMTSMFELIDPNRTLWRYFLRRRYEGKCRPNFPPHGGGLKLDAWCQVCHKSPFPSSSPILAQLDLMTGLFYFAAHANPTWISLDSRRQTAEHELPMDAVSQFYNIRRSSTHHTYSSTAPDDFTPHAEPQDLRKFDELCSHSVYQRTRLLEQMNKSMQGRSNAKANPRSLDMLICEQCLSRRSITHHIFTPPPTSEHKTAAAPPHCSPDLARIT